MTVRYTLGVNSYTNIIRDYQGLLNKQINLSLPLITGALIYKKNKQEQKIFVGKEIDLRCLQKDNYWIKKYDLILDELIELVLNGYERACLLNYKKYDQVIVGVCNDDIIVPYYYALRSKLNNEIKEREI